jgi:hypothetical protein
VDERGSALHRLRRDGLEPVGYEVEAVLGRVDEPRALHHLVPVVDAHEAGARRVRLLRDGAHDRRVLDVPPEHEDVLTRRDARADPHGEPREARDVPADRISALLHRLILPRRRCARNVRPCRRALGQVAADRVAVVSEPCGPSPGGS